MNCNVTSTPEFAKQIKRFGKKYKSIKEDYARFLNEINENPLIGKQLGNHLRKIRFVISDKVKGKSGGARVISHTILIKVDEANVTLLTIYDKSETGNISS